MRFNIVAIMKRTLHEQRKAASSSSKAVGVDTTTKRMHTTWWFEATSMNLVGTQYFLKQPHNIAAKKRTLIQEAHYTDRLTGEG